MRLRDGALLACATLPLAGCVPMMATNAANNTARIAMGAPKDNAGSGNAALDACTARAQSYGVVHIINVEQPGAGTTVVWGTVTAGQARQSFKCVYRSEIRSFTLRPIPAQAG